MKKKKKFYSSETNGKVTLPFHNRGKNINVLFDLHARRSHDYWCRYDRVKNTKKQKIRSSADLTAIAEFFLFAPVHHHDDPSSRPVVRSCSRTANVGWQAVCWSALEKIATDGKPFTSFNHVYGNGAESCGGEKNISKRRSIKKKKNK